VKLPTVDIFCISYPRDYGWLPYLWRSIDRFVTGFRQVVLVLERGDPLPASLLPAYVKVKRCRRYRGTDIEGYWGQSIECLRAHRYTDADVVWFAEADWMFVRPIDLQRDRQYPIAKPIILHDDWSRVGLARKWKEPTEAIIQPLRASHETMRKPPFWYPRSFIRDVWQQFGGARLFELVRGGLLISQFNVLGAAALALNRANQGKHFTELHIRKARVPKPCVIHFWQPHDVLDPTNQRALRRLRLTP
jgi:hypothetical protein